MVDPTTFIQGSITATEQFGLQLRPGQVWRGEPGRHRADVLDLGLQPRQDVQVEGQRDHRHPRRAAQRVQSRELRARDRRGHARGLRQPRGYRGHGLHERELVPARSTRRTRPTRRASPSWCSGSRSRGIESGGALARHRDGRSRAPPETPLARRRRCAAPPRSMCSCPSCGAAAQRRRPRSFCVQVRGVSSQTQTPSRRTTCDENAVPPIAS